MSGIPTCASPLSASGAFVQSSRDGRLQALAAEVAGYSRLFVQKTRIDQKLQDCNDPIWLAEFARRVGQGDFEARLRGTIEVLLRKRDALIRELATARDRLGDQAPAFPSVVEASSRERAVTGATSNRQFRPAHNQLIAERNRIIKKYRHLSHLQICYRLDEVREPGTDFSRLLPDLWKMGFGVKTFVSAYRLKQCRPRVQRLISGAKKH